MSVGGRFSREAQANSQHDAARSRAHCQDPRVMHPCPRCGAELALSRSRKAARCPQCKSRFIWVMGSGWTTPEAAEAASYRNDTRGYELRQVIRGYLVDPQSLKDHEPTWAEILGMVNQILSNPLFDFADLTLVSNGDGEAVIADATGKPLARVELESPGRVRVTPLDQ